MMIGHVSVERPQDASHSTLASATTVSIGVAGRVGAENSLIVDVYLLARYSVHNSQALAVCETLPKR